MTANERYIELADAGTVVLKTDGGKTIEIFEMLISSDTDGATITVADNNTPSKSYKFFLSMGLNEIIEWVLIFMAGKDVTITCGGGNITAILRYNLK